MSGIFTGIFSAGEPSRGTLLLEHIDALTVYGDQLKPSCKQTGEIKLKSGRTFQVELWSPDWSVLGRALLLGKQSGKLSVSVSGTVNSFLGGSSKTVQEILLQIEFASRDFNKEREEI